MTPPPPSKYITTFRKMSEKCNSGGQFNEHLKEWLVKGVRNKEI